MSEYSRQQALHPSQSEQFTFADKFYNSKIVYILLRITSIIKFFSLGVMDGSQQYFEMNRIDHSIAQVIQGSVSQLAESITMYGSKPRNIWKNGIFFIIFLSALNIEKAVIINIFKRPAS